MKKQPTPELIDDENPEWTAEVLARARPASEVLPEIFGGKVAKTMLNASLQNHGRGLAGSHE